VWWTVFGQSISWGLGYIYVLLSANPMIHAIGAYGLAIVLLTIAIKVLLAPLFQLQLMLSRRSMTQQRRLAPELAELEFAVIDLETTGWSPGVAAITEIAAVRVRGGQRQGEFASLVNPDLPVPPGIADLTGITDWMLAAAPRLGAVLPGLLDFARGCVLVAHNAPFDLGFLVAGCGDCGLAWPGFAVLDTVMLARQVMDPDEVPDCKLGTLAGFFRARTAPNHRALADARATADVLGWLIRRLAHRGIRTLNQLSAWPDVVA